MNYINANIYQVIYDMLVSRENKDQFKNYRITVFYGVPDLCSTSVLFSPQYPAHAVNGRKIQYEPDRGTLQ